MHNDTTLEDGLSEVAEILGAHARPALDALECAETVEYIADLAANLDDAILHLHDALAATQALRKQVKPVSAHDRWMAAHPGATCSCPDPERHAPAWRVLAQYNGFALYLQHANGAELLHVGGCQWQLTYGGKYRTYDARFAPTERAERTLQEWGTAGA